MGIFKSQKFPINVISVGNLTMGGTGKTPHIEYLVNLLGDSKSVATLSRGYKRKSKGFVLANEQSTAKIIGDEPMQFYNKFDQVNVAVDEDRAHGIKELKKLNPDLKTVLLDDAYQHLSVHPNLNILLIDYSTIGETDFVLPSGRLREFRKNINRADAIIVSKCPHILSPIEKRRILDGLNTQDSQKIFFSYVDFQDFQPVTKPAKSLLENGFKLADHRVVGLTGIANNSNFVDHLSRYSKQAEFIQFDDHHDYSLAEILKLEKELKSYTSQSKTVITTEKDAVKLLDDRLYPVIKNLPIMVLPIEIKFHEDEEEVPFNNFILDHVKSN